MSVEPRILIVDDEEHIRYLYSEELSEVGYEVITADSGYRLLEKIEEEKPDLVVLDIKMVDYNGLDLLQDIRTNLFFLPVVICTAYDTFSEDRKASAADFYVIKSFDVTELKEKVALALKDRIDVETIGESNALDHIKAVLIRLLNYQPEFLPIPEKIPYYPGLIKDFERRGCFSFLSKEEVDILLKALCLDFYMEGQRATEMAYEWLMTHGSWDMAEFVDTSYEKACPKHLLSPKTFKSRFDAAKLKLEGSRYRLRSDLRKAKENIKEGYISEVPVDRLKTIFLPESDKVSNPKKLIKYLNDAIFNLDINLLSKVPMDELEDAFRSVGPKPHEAKGMGDIILRDIRHDLKNKLSNMLIHLDKLKEGAPISPYTQKPENQVSISGPLAKLFEIQSELLLLYQQLKNITVFDIISRFELVDLKNLVRRVLSGLGLIDSKRINLDYRQFACKTITDANLLGVALNQVTQNAADAIDLHGTINISLKRDEEQGILSFIIEDNGCGIPDHILDKVFEPSYSYKKRGHSGMGLALAKAALSAIRGKITLDSNPGVGTVAEVQIPWEH